ncbi:glycosyltransferase family A protein [Aequorivita sp. SDUM287046]|uniref:Glycosyltransferase family A protein n=1 Tax=Aequorivita aurantiaca TaxID=3053356 RepID=A0ABT8DPW2_9FLAO|nr:glycosyltransferase family A protein [Aequorivita aurantiaca]MDN3725288.1 glycosyltransferase family A protein [Aequorivita aurantiaca]
MEEDKEKNSGTLISVIVTTYNRSVYLYEALDSIAKQTYRNIEILLIDDGSTKQIALENKEICKKFSVCKYYYKENSGQPDSRNFGIKKSKGAYIGFCDDDDLWAIDKLERQIVILNTQNEFGLVTGCIEYISHAGMKTGILKCHAGHNHGNVFQDFLIKNRTASITPLIRREVIDKVGLFNPNFTIGEDWDYWRKVSFYFKFYAIDDVLAFVRTHENTMSRTRSTTLLGRFVLYRKLNQSLFEWGNGRFAKNDWELVEYIEWCYYRRLLNNNMPGFKKKFVFVLLLFTKNIIPPLYFIKLFLKYNSRYKPQV